MERFFVCETLVDLNAGYSLNVKCKTKMYVKRHLYCRSFQAKIRIQFFITIA